MTTAMPSTGVRRRDRSDRGEFGCVDRHGGPSSFRSEQRFRLPAQDLRAQDLPYACLCRQGRTLRPPDWHHPRSDVRHSGDPLRPRPTTHGRPLRLWRARRRWACDRTSGRSARSSRWDFGRSDPRRRPEEFHPPSRSGLPFEPGGWNTPGVGSSGQRPRKERKRQPRPSEPTGRSPMVPPTRP